MYFTSGNDRAFEQPQPRPEQPEKKNGFWQKMLRKARGEEK